MKKIQTIQEHIVIRETCGYDVISQIDVFDLPQVLHFLNICHNYMKLKRIESREK
jgi:hypothetical protein